MRVAMGSVCMAIFGNCAPVSPAINRSWIDQMASVSISINDGYLYIFSTKGLYLD